MIDLPNTFWSGWVLVLTIGSGAVLVWLVVNVYFSDAAVNEDAHDQVWDENLKEGSNAPPLWWFWLIFVALIFSVCYLLLYPGLGSFQGALKWSQSKRLAESTALHALQFQQQQNELTTLDTKALAGDAKAMKTAAKIFANHCGSCHGPNGQGQAQFPDLTDNQWQWGNDATAIKTSITQGRTAIMPGWAGVLDEVAIDAVARHVKALGTGAQTESGKDTLGAETYANLCASCHGAEAGGNPAVGAPSLIDDEWLYGDSEFAIRQSIALGRSGIMPAHGERLSAFQIALLTAWLEAGLPTTKTSH